MKFKKYIDDYMYEEFNNQQTKKQTKRNKKDNIMTDEEKESCAKELVNKSVDYKNILGYISKDKETGNINYVKYDKDKEFMVVYNKNGKIITSFNRPYREFTGKMYDANERYEYIDELSTCI